LNDSISCGHIQQHEIFLCEMVQEVGQAHLHIPITCQTPWVCSFLPHAWRWDELWQAEDLLVEETSVPKPR